MEHYGTKRKRKELNRTVKVSIKNCDNILAYPILIESPIIRQLIFPGFPFNGGPGLQMRSAGIADPNSPVFGELNEAKFKAQHTRKNEEFIPYSLWFFTKRNSFPSAGAQHSSKTFLIVPCQVVILKRENTS